MQQPGPSQSEDLVSIHPKDPPGASGEVRDTAGMSERVRDLEIGKVGEHLEQPVQLIRRNRAGAGLGCEEVFPRGIGNIVSRAQICIDNLRVVRPTAPATHDVAGGSRPAKSLPEQDVACQYRDPDRKRYVL